MGKIFPSLLIICFLFNGPLCHAQTLAKISDPRLELRDNILHISYDFLNSDPSDKFNVTIDIKDEYGNNMEANALVGDLGEDVSGGSDKHVSWNLKADNVVINSYLDIKINAIKISSPEPVKPESEQENTQEMGKIDDSADHNLKEEVKTLSYNRTGIVIQSLPLPGLGLSRVTGNPHWIRGVVGYGCLVGSFALNKLSVSTFNSISDLDEVVDVNDAFNRSVLQDNISEVLAYAGLGIWITDIIWTVIGTSDLKTPPLFRQSGGFSMRSHIDPLSNAPMINLRYKF